MVYVDVVCDVATAIFQGNVHFIIVIRVRKKAIIIFFIIYTYLYTAFRYDR